MRCVFCRVGVLDVRMRRNSGKKSSECNICRLQFLFRSYIKTHMSTHTGEKRYSCDISSRTSAQFSRVLLYVRIHTGKIQLINAIFVMQTLNSVAI